MKKYLIPAILALALAITAAACTDKGNNGEETSGNTADTTVADVTTEEPTDSAAPETTVADVTTEEVTEPEVTEPEVTEPEVTEPEVTEPEVTEPEVTEPEVTEPENPNDVYDVAGNPAAVEFTPAGYTDKVLQLMNYGTAHDLGTLDLSKYSAMIITYGSDSSAMLGDVGSELYLTKNGAVENEKSEAIEGVEVIGKATLSNATGVWVGGSRTVTIEFDTDYVGNVYLALNMMDGNGIAVSAIELVPAEEPAILSSNKTTYTVGEPILVTAYGSGTDWVGLGRVGETSTIRWFYLDPVDGYISVGAGVEFDLLQEANYNAGFDATVTAGNYIIYLMPNDQVIQGNTPLATIEITVTE